MVEETYINGKNQNEEAEKSQSKREKVDAEKAQDTCEKHAGEVQAIKYTINNFLEIIREIFDSDACYLYLISPDMDIFEQEIILRDRVNNIEKNYSQRGKHHYENPYFLNELKSYKIKDVTILKFINVVERTGQKNWNYGYNNRPQKYVIFRKYNKIYKNSEEIFNEGITAYTARRAYINSRQAANFSIHNTYTGRRSYKSSTQAIDFSDPIICNNKDEIREHISSANLNSVYDIKPISEMTISFPLLTIKKNKFVPIGVLTIENYSSEKTSSYTQDSPEIKQTKGYLPLLVKVIESAACHHIQNSYSKLFKGISILDHLKKEKFEHIFLIDVLDQLTKSLEDYLQEELLKPENSSHLEVNKKRLNLAKKRFVVKSLLDHLKNIEPNLLNGLMYHASSEPNNLYENLKKSNLEGVQNEKYSSLEQITPEFYENLKKDENADINNKSICCDNLLKYLQKTKCSELVNSEIYRITLHLFLILKRNEYIGYEEILNRISGYANDICKLLDLPEGMTRSFSKYLEEVRKHEELLLYGLNDYRDHFMHQFHVFICGYIIINEIGIGVFRDKIEASLKTILGKQKSFKPDKSDVLRIWFLTAFYHDHAYILEEIDVELANFFKDIFGYRFSVKFNWEDLLTKGNDFAEYLNYMVKFFTEKTRTANQGTLLRNYLDSIIKHPDHGVLGALLLLHYSYKSKVTQDRFNQCLYAAFAISLHNKRVYENLRESVLSSKKSGISFESFPIAFLLAYCDTAQSFGRLEGRDHDGLYKYPVKFHSINVEKEDKKISFKLEYISNNLEQIPRSDMINKWANKIDTVFYSEDFIFEIKYLRSENEPGKDPELIYNLSFR